MTWRRLPLLMAIGFLGCSEDTPLPSGNAASPPHDPAPLSYDYTEEEHKDLKASRESVGIHHLDRIYTETELDELLRVGMADTDVVDIFGKPSMTNEQEGAARVTLSYSLAPEKMPLEAGMHNNGFTAHIFDGSLKAWTLNYSTATRPPKYAVTEPHVLEIKPPAIDFSQADADFVAYIEGIEIANPHQTLNSSDAGALMTMVAQVYEIVRLEPSGDSSIRENCDVLEILAYNIPEVASLCDSNSSKSVSLAELSVILAPYWRGQKVLPKRSQAGD
jgi:hypothetical protein